MTNGQKGFTLFCILLVPFFIIIEQVIVVAESVHHDAFRLYGNHQFPRSLHWGNVPLLCCLAMPIDHTKLYWFPLRVANHREFRIRDELSRLAIEIFVHATQETITTQKMFNSELSYLRYKMNVVDDGEGAHTEIMTVPDREMDAFIKVTRCSDARLQYLVYTDFLDKEGRKVKVIDGDFAGVEGQIKRIRKDRCVVVCVRGVAAVALQIPFEQLEFIK